MRTWWLVASVLALVGCSGISPGKAVTPDTPKVEEPPAKAAECKEDQSYKILAVDWEPEVRGDLEVAMKQGIAVVRYSCDSIELLSDCTLDGSYGFLSMSRKEKVLSMEDESEIGANLPLSGIKFLAKIGGSLKRGTSLKAAMVMVGKRSSTRKSAERSELDGAACGQATHFVRSATVGAFVLETGASGQAQAAAKFFGEQGAEAKSAGKKQVLNRDGDLKACDGIRDTSTQAPNGCGAPLRLELRPIAAADTPAPTAAAAETASCPTGLVLTDAGCERAEDDRPFQCAPGDRDACTAQCERGHAGSCFVLASLDLTAGNRASARKLFARACEAGHGPSCSAITTVGGKPAANTVELLARGCQNADGESCIELGIRYTKARPARNKEAVTLFRRACYGASYEGCTWLGILHMRGTGGLGKKPKLANKFFEKGCKEGSMLGCHKLAVNKRGGKGGKKDEAAANELYKRACAGGHKRSCDKVR